MSFKFAKTFKNLATTAVLATAVILTGCGKSDDPNGPLKVGIMAGPEADVMKVAADIAKKEHNVDVQLIEFSDYVSPNVALADGSIDANAFQHRPYLDSMVRDRGFKLVAVGNTFVYPIAAFSKKINDISELQDGATIAIPNDPSNEGRTLILFHQKGYIALKDVNNLEATPADIIENPRNFRLLNWTLPSCHAPWMMWTWPSSTIPTLFRRVTFLPNTVCWWKARTHLT